MATETIGTGGDRATFSAWYSAISSTTSEAEIGQLLGQAFTDLSWEMNGKTTSEANYIHLTAHPDHRHDGRSHDVSGAGNARAVWSTNVRGVHMGDEFLRLSWVEVDGSAYSGNNKQSIRVAYQAASNAIYIHHNVIHNDLTTGSGGTLSNGIHVNDSDAKAKIYRNIVYGSDDHNIDNSSSTEGCHIIHNTCYETGNEDGISAKTDDVVESNATFNADGDDLAGAGTEDDNATSDSTGDSGASLTSLTATNEFKYATNTWGSTDLRVKNNTNLRMKSSGSPYSSSDFPEIDIDIRGRPITETPWTVGADQVDVVGGGAGVGGASSVSPYIYGS